MIRINTKGIKNVNSIKVAENFNNKMMDTSSLDYAGADMYGAQQFVRGYWCGVYIGAVVASVYIGGLYLINKVDKLKNAKQKEKDTE